MGRVDGKVVLITGAASGQGAAEAAALAAEGAQVIATDVQDPLEPPPAGVTFRRLDVGQPDDWEDTAAWLRGELGTVHGLVNNAGITWRARLDEVRLEDWDRVLRINLTSAMLGIQAITPLMTNGGSVVNISSRAGLSGHFTVAYTVAKWGLRGLSRVASMELGPKGIRCNCLFPGYIDTPMVRTAPEAFVEASLKEIPMGRKGTPDDIAPLVVYLISDESTYINGTEISVDGGEWAHGGTTAWDGRRELARGNAEMKQGHVDSLNATHARPGVMRRVFSGDGATLAFTTMEPGHEAVPHSHPHEQIEYLLQGRMRFVVGDEETILERGGLLVVPGGVEHYGETLGDEPIVALSVFSPRRDEYAAEER